MQCTFEELEPPLKGHMDCRNLMLAAINHNVYWEYRGEKTPDGWKAHVRLGDIFAEADDPDEQRAVDKATELAVERFTNLPSMGGDDL